MTNIDKATKVQPKQIRKKPGRPTVGVTKENANDYWCGITSWIANYKLDRWLKDSGDWSSAKQAMENISISDEDMVDQLNYWCQAWLSKEGWERLQANVRQKGYVQGRATKTKNKKPRQRKRTLQIDEGVAVRLGHYSNSRKMTISEAVEKLLTVADELEKNADDFQLEHDRYVWQCAKCLYLVEADSESDLRAVQSRHKVADCKVGW